MTLVKSTMIPVLFNFLYWRTSPALSIACCVGWQLLISYPTYIPACVPLLLCFALTCTYKATAKDASPRPTIYGILRMLLFNRAPMLQELHGLLENSTPSFRRRLSDEEHGAAFAQKVQAPRGMAPAELHHAATASPLSRPTSRTSPLSPQPRSSL